MTGLILSVSYQGSMATLPEAIAYPAALTLRKMAIVQDELPKYMLVPCLHSKMLLATLWNTGARIIEALALTLAVFLWHSPTRSFSLPPSSSERKKRTE